ncbi:MAG: Rod shape-determining protein mreB [Candidatus Amesbacteria bacterium GW2011_GWA2_42_12]|uniref:Cell shape-determining protein MreB n=1 Tax=Candidatus Amesbacteria bacterium GW2011_GWA2_42_12 TaxID=1618356 RepID=A0A0G0Y6Q0_9BACT|nr:MAG: Rod shape-determining protein mreB [Candidatus Amesbacteria bacterium GW2011_GWA2_42_12]
MLNKRIGIDLGTANSLVWVAGQGLVMNEPTVVAVGTEDGRIVAVGNEAKEMLGRTPGNITASRPMRDGVIADYRVTEAMLKYFIQKVCGRIFLFKPEVMICVPAGVTQVERRAVLDATLSAGAKAAYLIDEPLAAAIGARLPIAAASGNMIIDIGGGSAEAAVICLGGVVVHKSVRVAGNKLDEAIIGYMKKKHNLLIGETTAEEAKIRIGSALVLDKPESMEIKGRDSITGLPRAIETSSTEITEAIRPVLLAIIGAAKGVLEETPPELASDIIDKGIIMSGGTSALRNFDRLMTELTGVPCHVAEDPLMCVVRGTGIAIENLDLYKKSIIKR